MINKQRPDRPISSALVPVRSAVRALRLFCLKARFGRKLQMGKNVYFGCRALMVPPEFVRFGDNVALGSDFHLETNLVVGSDVLISSRVAIIGNDHRFDDPDTSIFWAGRYPPSTVYIEGDNLIGFGVTIIGNVRIGKGCIVGARAVVTTDLPPNTVCVGIPAKPIGLRFTQGVSAVR